jgi:hypothetical protein
MTTPVIWAPDWAIEAMLAVGFTEAELAAAPMPLTPEELAEYLALDDLDQREFSPSRRRMADAIGSLTMPRAAE